MRVSVFVPIKKSLFLFSLKLLESLLAAEVFLKLGSWELNALCCSCVGDTAQSRHGSQDLENTSVFTGID